MSPRSRDMVSPRQSGSSLALASIGLEEDSAFREALSFVLPGWPPQISCLRGSEPPPHLRLEPPLPADLMKFVSENRSSLTRTRGSGPKTGPDRPIRKGRD